MNISSALTLLVLLGAVIGYLIGSIAWSVIIGKFLYKKDPRDFESHNIGATNSARVFGKRMGLIILLLDMLKGFVPVLIMWIIYVTSLEDILGPTITKTWNPKYLIYLSGAFAVIGHCYPCFFNFRGGKGAATTGGLFWAISPILAIVCLAVFFVVSRASKYVSLGSMVTALACAFILLIPGIHYCYFIDTNFNNDVSFNMMLLYLAIILLALGSLITYKHKTNIIRLLNHNERKIK